MTEAESMMEWLRYRANMCRSSGVLRLYQMTFVEMWKEHFGTTDNIPRDFKDEIESIYRQYKQRESENESI